MYDWQRQLIAAGLPLDVYGPSCSPATATSTCAGTARAHRAKGALPSTHADSLPY
ncbi:hypothetical protein QNM99_21105 [Pseudomonas sp. PCH446]